VMISDLGLPGASGFDLMRQARDRHEIPGIAISGYGMEEDMQKSRESGFCEHLVKPLRIDQLESSIRRALHMSAA